MANEPTALLQSLRGGGGGATEPEDVIGEVDSEVEIEDEPHPAPVEAAAAPEEAPALSGEPADGDPAPAVPAPYALTLPTDLLPSEIPDGYEETLSSAAAALASGGVDQVIAQRLTNLFIDTALEMGGMGDVTNRFADQDCVNALHREWGSDYVKNLKVAKDAADHLGSEFKRFLDDSRLGNSAAVLVSLYRYGVGILSHTPESARTKLTKIAADPKNMDAVSDSERRKRTTFYRTYGRIASENDKPEQPKRVLTVPKPDAGATAKADARREAAALLADTRGPLMVNSHPDHKASVARFHLLLATLD